MEPGHDEITGVADPVLRNLWITQRYHELSLAMRGCGAAEDATWCAFAVWASKTAGSVIRNEDLPAVIRRIVAERTATHVERFNSTRKAQGIVGELLENRHLVSLTDRVCADVSGRIAEGNALVFAELAAPFEALVGAWPRGPGTAVGAAVAAIPEGADRRSLSRVFELYGRALSAPPPETAPLVLAANILAVAHEQQRLQPAIAAALDAAVQDLVVKEFEDGPLRLVPAPVRRLLRDVVVEMAAVLDEICQGVLTAAMLRLVTYDETLDLGIDLPMLDGVMWPRELVEVGEAAAVLALWDLTKGTGRPTGARDWAHLNQRMNYIVNLFRSRQRHPALFEPPFSDAQLAGLRAWRIPDGPL